MTCFCFGEDILAADNFLQDFVKVAGSAPIVNEESASMERLLLESKKILKEAAALFVECVLLSALKVLQSDEADKVAIDKAKSLVHLQQGNIVEGKFGIAEGDVQPALLAGAVAFL